MTTSERLHRGGKLSHHGDAEDKRPPSNGGPIHSESHPLSRPHPPRHQDGCSSQTVSHRKWWLADHYEPAPPSRALSDPTQRNQTGCRHPTVPTDQCLGINMTGKEATFPCMHASAPTPIRSPGLYSSSYQGVNLITTPSPPHQSNPTLKGHSSSHQPPLSNSFAPQPHHQPSVSEPTALLTSSTSLNFFNKDDGRQSSSFQSSNADTIDDCATSRAPLGHSAQLLGKPYPSGGCTIPQAGGDCKGAKAGSSVVPKRPQRYASPPKYASATAKKIAKAKRKLAREHSATPAHLIIISPSVEPISTKPLIRLPQHGHLSRNCILTQGRNPQFILDVHSFSSPPTPTFLTLSQIISDLYQMALNRSDNKRNTNLLGGSMRGIGFRQGSDSRKSGGKPILF